MPYLALPSVLDGMSKRGMLLPTMRYADGCFSSDSSTFGSSAGTVANCAISPYVMRRPLAACTTVLGSVETSASGTPHLSAAACISTRRAWAP